MTVTVRTRFSVAVSTFGAVLPPLSVIEVSVITRSLVLGSVLVFLYAKLVNKLCQTAVLWLLDNVTVAAFPLTVTVRFTV